MTNRFPAMAARPLIWNRPRLRFIEGAPEGAAEVTPEVEQPKPQAPAKEPAEVDWKSEARKWESRAKENYEKAEANSSAAARLAEIEEAQKSEQQKLTERAEAAEKQASDAAARLLKYEVATEHGLTGDALKLLSGTSKEALEEQAKAILELRGEAKPAVPKPDPTVGPKGSAKPTNLGAAIAAHYN